MTIGVYESTRFESLWREFECSIARPLSSPLAPETIVVPARGWDSWFSRRLAKQRGCWAQFRFLLPGQWISETLENCLATEQAPKREQDALTWIIANQLPELLDDDAFGAVRGYLFQPEGGTDAQRLIDLSRCISDLFDRYLLHRPELIAAWNQGVDWPERGVPAPPAAAWQRRLWQAITQDKRRRYRSVAAMSENLKEAIQTGAGQIPERLSVWLCGSVVPAHLRFLEAVGEHCDVGLYVLTPACEYWGDMYGRRQLLRRLREHPQSLRQFCIEHHVDLLHPLLASMGELSRQQQMLMVDLDSSPWQIRDLAADVSDDDSESDEETSTLLRELQNDIRLATEPRRRLLPRDNSVRIHSCHSAIREVEVLHDRIREALEEDSELAPEEITVLCPDLDNYAPLIQAVFGLTRPGTEGHIPFQVAGRSARRTRPVIDAWLKVLEVFESRVSATDILDLLNTEVVRQRVGLDSSDVEKVAEWIDDAGIRWGLDAEHRQSENLPGTDLNTWEFGLDRLALGYAMPPASSQMVGQVSTLDRVEGLTGATLGKLWSLITRLRQWRERIRQERPLADWREPLGRVARDFLQTDLDETGYQIVLDAIDDVATLAEAGDFDRPVSFAVAVQEVTRQLDSAAAPSFRTGGIVFCDMSAMRSLPGKVIALLGMNDGLFPRGDRSVGFDLMKFQRVLGDNRPRDEDRHLFLEAILAASDRLIITCQGQDVRDQRPRPPSVPVQELLDVLSQTDGPAIVERDDGEFGVADDDEFSEVEADADDSVTDNPAATSHLRETVFIRHPLQAFGTQYFHDSGNVPASFDSASLKAAQRLQIQSESAAVFASRLLPPPAAANRELNDAMAEPESVSVGDLRILHERPWLLFLRRVGVGDISVSEDSSDREPLVLDGLQNWQAGDTWLEQSLAGVAQEQIAQQLIRTGSMPAGSAGESVVRKLKREASRIIARMQEDGLQTVTDSLPVNLHIGDILLTGEISGWTGDAIHRGSFSKGNVKYAARLWVDYLIATVICNRVLPPAILVGRDDTRVTLTEITPHEAFTHLETLVGIWQIARCFPLPFFMDEKVVKPVWKNEVDFADRQSTTAYVAAARNTFVQEPFGKSASGRSRPAPADEPDARVAFAGLQPFDLRCDVVPAFAEAGDRNLFAWLAETLCVPFAGQLESFPG
ncbi:MAG: exodeoxyribonuclease V subunit gamma [Rhodopirellula sp.]|nr:exodeoxyribonuclease V subunit gamma [Rhodopirellula sp.]